MEARKLLSELFLRVGLFGRLLRRVTFSLFFLIVTSLIINNSHSLSTVLDEEKKVRIIRLPQEGEVYGIKEKDALEEIKEKASKVNIAEIRKKVLESFEKQMKVKTGLPHACENSTFSFYPIYTLDVDIKDDKGNVIYPKGYSFNPLDYMPFPFTFVFFDGTSQREIDWIKKAFLKNDSNVFLVVTEGDIREVVKKLGRPVYAMNELMKERFRVRKTPSVVRAVGNYLVVSEIGIHNCASKRAKK